MQCPDLSDLDNVDRLVMDYARDLGWSSLSTRFVKAAKEKIQVVGTPAAGFDSTVTNILEFMGAHRKILIDYMLGRLKQSLPRSRLPIQSDAFGSTKATSDYDLTIIGPGSYFVVRCIVDRFFEWTNHRTMSFVFDSNLYIGPDILVTDENRERFDKLGVKTVRIGESTKKAIPFPDDSGTLAMERESILGKLGKDDSALTDDEIMARYHTLTDLGKGMDAFVYGSVLHERGEEEEEEGGEDGGGGFGSKALYFEHLFRMNEAAIEGYHGLSTILFVVHGMQAGHMATIRPHLQEAHLHNAALENVIDLTNHWNAAVRHTSTHEALDAVGLKLKKYLLRILEALGLVSAKETAVLMNEPGPLREFMGLGADETIDPKSHKGLIGAMFRDLTK